MRYDEGRPSPWRDITLMISVTLAGLACWALLLTVLIVAVRRYAT